jgi:hypothetical protein
VIVALGALQILAQKQPADVAREAGEVGRVLAVGLQAFGHEEGRAARLLVFWFWRKDVAGQLIPRFIRGK